MANSPVDRDPSYMEEQWGTRVLITDPGSDHYLRKARKNDRYQIPDDRYSRPCGGQGGFDDFVERMED